MKMSKSKPGSAIPILADQKEISSIIGSAWCPEGVTAENPVLLLCRYVIFPSGKSLKVERPSKYGGDAEFSSYGGLEAAYAARKLHPTDLKNAAASALSAIMEPIHRKFGSRRQEISELFAA